MAETLRWKKGRHYTDQLLFPIILFPFLSTGLFNAVGAEMQLPRVPGWSRYLTSSMRTLRAWPEDAQKMRCS